MTLGPTLALVGAVFSAGPFGAASLEAGVRSGTSIRVIDEEAGPGAEGGGETRRVVEARLSPRLALATDGRIHLLLAYAPVLHAQGSSGAEGLRPEEEWRPNVLHAAELRLESAGGPWRWRGGVDATYGWADVAAQGNLGTSPVATPERLPFRSSAAGAGITIASWQRTTLSFDGRTTVSGGDGTTAEQLLPVQREWVGSSTLETRVSHLDTASLAASATTSDVEGGSHASTIQLGLGWARALSRHGSARVAAGVAGASERAADGSAATGAPRLAPWFRATYGHAGDRRPSVDVAAGAEPAIDRIGGAVDVRWFAEARAGWSPLRDWHFAASVQVAALDPWLGYEEREAGRTWLGGGGLRAGWRFGRDFVIEGGLGQTWQSSGRADLSSFRELAATIELTTNLPPIRESVN